MAESKAWVEGSSISAAVLIAGEQTGNFSSHDTYIGSRAETSFFATMEIDTLAFYDVDTAAQRVNIEVVAAL